MSKQIEDESSEGHGAASPRYGFWQIPILYRYILLEIVTPFAVCLFVFTGILFLAKSLRLLELIVAKNVSVWVIIRLFLLVVPQFLEMAIPMALLLGVMLAFGRLSSDSELVVLRATGISIRQLVLPVFSWAFVCTVACMLIAFYLRPWSNHQLNVGLFELAKMRASSGLVEGVFNEFGPLTIYAERIGGGGGKLDNVIIADRRDPEKPRDFVAKHGQIISDTDSLTLSLRLFDGTIHEGSSANYNLTEFDINSIVLEENELMSGDEGRSRKKSSELVIGELLTLRRNLLTKKKSAGRLGEKDEQQIARIGVEFHRRLALPVACLMVALIGMSLGVQPSRGGKSWGAALNMLLGLLVITAYYFLLAFATALGEQGVAAPGVAMWLPNIIFGALAIYIYRRIETEEWLTVSQAIAEFASTISQRLMRRFNV